MRKAKLQIYSIDRLHRQAVDSLLENASTVAETTGARGAIVLLLTREGRTIVKSAGALSQNNSMLAELFRSAVRAADG